MNTDMIPETPAEVLAWNMTRHGYGASYERIKALLVDFTDDQLEILAYQMYRTAEKTGMDAFDTYQPVEG
ncbi:hypothetical protein [Bacillus phage Hakuna]|uniref:Uncharacterized protein n=2 Tax=Wphvirus TaxID=1922327 RepID=A0A024B259_9CAUD|nr:hypothetical protein FP72_gp233 [Bacillus phage Hakuna]YP_009279408.1 hypothetical protein BIZ89_gp241 [Bacillus phage Kida]YP_009281039.1 hypothetical protein SAGEFAYGE_236 [Bacillus phage SageFayge]QDH49511.1 hypothetical protein PHIREBALL_237 [Bacillus phage Phireball]AHZ10251.1 hypothetical protein [Bacillus phage Hakuna]AMW63156.1 hypothetical protein SAGEFAYGE_236 [Bacillus phage SageFayge]ANU79862.1 hypothetical protein KIDA_243 [Bacillus phage Kida]